MLSLPEKKLPIFLNFPRKKTINKISVQYTMIFYVSDMVLLATLREEEKGKIFIMDAKKNSSLPTEAIAAS